ncbi:CHAT domain-containing protein [Streptomyces lasiicapitis]|uniref:CHAT domain-containing protein n=1 Tax=Streptomyces lasiicapitis TaxID=1923961 RepID=UPI003682C726
MTGEPRLVRGRHRAQLRWRRALSHARAALNGDLEALARLFDDLTHLRQSASALRPATAARDLTMLISFLDALGHHEAVQSLLDDLAAGILQDSVHVSHDAACRNQLAVVLAGRGQLTAAARLLDDARSSDTGAATTAPRARTLANTAAVALRLGDISAAADQARQALDVLAAGTAPEPHHDVQLLALAVSTAAARAMGEDARADNLLTELDASVRDLVRERGSDHPTSLSALVTLASAESSSARAAGDRERLERATDVLAIAAQKASALMGPEHPQAVSATLALAAAEYEAASGSGPRQRVDDAKELMAAAAERAGTLLRDAGAAGDPEGTRDGEGARSTGGAGGSARGTLGPAPHADPAPEPTEAELVLTREQVLATLADLPSDAPRAPVLLGLLGELTLHDYVYGDGAPSDLLEAAEAFRHAFRAPVDTTYWHRWRILYGYANALRYEAEATGDLEAALDLLDEALELLASGVRALPSGLDSDESLRWLGVQLLANCSRKRYEECRDHHRLRPGLQLPDLLDEALRHHDTAVALVPSRTPEAAALIEAIGHLHLERYRLLGGATTPALGVPPPATYSDNSSGTTWEALAATVYAYALIWRDTGDHAHAAVAHAGLDTLLAAPDSLDGLSPRVLDTLARLAHHQSVAGSDLMALDHAIALLSGAVDKWPEARKDERNASALLLLRLRLDRLVARRDSVRPDDPAADLIRELEFVADQGELVRRQLIDVPDLYALLSAAEPDTPLVSSLADRLTSTDRERDLGFVRLSAAHNAVRQAQSCLHRGDLRTTDHFLAEATGIHATLDSDHPARVELWMLLSRTGLLRDSLARRRGKEPETHLIAPPPTPAQIRQGAARLSGDRRTELLGEAGVSLLLTGSEDRYAEAVGLVREAYEALDTRHEGFVRFAYYLGAAECSRAAARSDRRARKTQLDRGIGILERAATAARSPHHENRGSVALALARAYRTRASDPADREASRRTGLEAARALATIAPASAPDLTPMVEDEIAARAASAAREVAAWCHRDGALTDFLHALELWRAQSVPGEPAGGPPTHGDIGRALRASGKDALVYLVPAKDSARGAALIVTASGQMHAVQLPELTEEAQPLLEYARNPSSRSDLCVWAARAAMAPVLSSFAPEHRPRRLVLVPMGPLGAVPWHAAHQDTGSPTGKGRRYAFEFAEFSYAVSARALCDAAATARAPGHRTPLTAAPVAADNPRDALSLLRAADPADGDVLQLAGPASYRTDGRDGPELVLSGGPLTMLSVADAIAESGRGGPAAVLVTDCRGNDLIRSDEASLRLADALLRAGAGAVVAPLWPVPDGTTSALLSLTHHFLRTQGTTPADALRMAQLSMLDPHRRLPPGLPPHLTDQAWHAGSDNHPDWAGYVCFGP